jgi:hypothetical protein
MKANVGSFDKALRFLAAIALFSMFFVLEGNARYVAILGLVPLSTALLSWCPLYTLLGVNTCPARS